MHIYLASGSCSLRQISFSEIKRHHFATEGQRHPHPTPPPSCHPHPGLCFLTRASAMKSSSALDKRQIQKQQRIVTKNKIQPQRWWKLSFLWDLQHPTRDKPYLNSPGFKGTRVTHTHSQIKRRQGLLY